MQSIHTVKYTEKNEWFYIGQYLICVLSVCMLPHTHTNGIHTHIYVSLYVRRIFLKEDTIWKMDQIESLILLFLCSCTIWTFKFFAECMYYLLNVSKLSKYKVNNSRRANSPRNLV